MMRTIFLAVAACLLCGPVLAQQEVGAAGSGSGDGAIQDGDTPSIEADVLDYTNANPLAVRLSDTNGDYVAAGAGTQYTEDDVGAANPIGGINMFLRQDTPAGLVSADGDVVGRRGTNFGAAFSQILDSSGNFVDTFGGGTQYTEGATDATITGTALLFEDNIGTSQLQTVNINTPLPINLQAIEDAAFTAGTPIPVRISHGVSYVDPPPKVTDDNTFTAATDQGVLIMGAFTADIVGPGDDLGAIAMSNDRRMLTDTQLVGQDADITIVGNKSNNGGVPGATNLGTLPAVANAAAPTHTETNQVALRTQLDGDLVVEMEDALPAGDNNVGNVDVASMPSNTTATGTLTAPAQVVTITVPQGGSSIGLQVTGTWTGQIEFEATVDGTNYVSVYASNNSGTSTNATTINGGFILPGAGFLTARVRASALSSGTANISFNASVGSSGATLTGPLPAGTNNIGDVDVATIAGGDNNIGNVDIVTFPDNEPIDVALMNGVAVTMGNGVSGTGVQRVTIASDSTGQVTANAGTNLNTSALLTTSAHDAAFGTAGAADAQVRTVQGIASGTPVIVGDGAGALNVIVDSITAGDTNIGNVDIVTLPDEGQQTAANSISVTPDTDNDAIGATGAAPPGEAVLVGGLASGATGGFLTAPPVCDSFEPVDIVTATTSLEITGVSARHVYVCAINLVTAAANNVAIIAGTGATCGTGTAGMNGGTTAAEGWNFAANGGIAQGSGFGAIMRTTDAGDSVCIITSAATQLSGTISYTIY